MLCLFFFYYFYSYLLFMLIYGKNRLVSFEKNGYRMVEFMSYLLIFFNLLFNKMIFGSVVIGNNRFNG
jgi:hypothetical protein